MQIELEIKNYRCFPDSSPATVTLDRKFVAILGANNTGKSSLLRFFYELRDLFLQFADANDDALAAGFGTGMLIYGFPLQISDPLEIFTKENARDLEILIRLQRRAFTANQAAPTPTGIVFKIARGQNTAKLQVLMDHERLQVSNAKIVRVPKKQGCFCLKDGENLVADITPYREACRILADTLYLGAFRNAINLGASTYFDIQIGQGFIAQWDNQKNGAGRLAAEASYKLEQAVAHIFGFKSLQVNAAPDRQTLQVFVDGRAYRLNELGSGLAQFIVVLANASIKTPAYILIDEPELNLHPSLQLDFLTTLGSFAREGVVFATHSYGLARASADAIYTVQRESGVSRLRQLEGSDNLAQLLGELSYGGYTALGFSQVLLVEGTTEVKSVQQLLRLYDKDHKILVLPMGGSSLINGRPDTEAALEEIKRITPNIAAVVDSEKDSEAAPLPKERQDFKGLCVRLKISCHILERRAFENYFTQSAIDAAGVGSGFRVPLPFDKIKSANSGWSKSWNWKVARQLQQEDINETDLGEFLGKL